MMKAVDDFCYDDLKLKPLEGVDIWKALRGKTVVGAWPADYPMTSGIEVLLQSPDGSYTLFETGEAEIDGRPELNPGDNFIYVAAADVPSEAVYEEQHDNWFMPDALKGRGSRPAAASGKP